MRKEEIKLGAMFRADTSFFDNADKETKDGIQKFALVRNGKVECMITDIYQSLFGTSYFNIVVDCKSSANHDVRVIVPFDADLSKLEMLSREETKAKILAHSLAYCDKMINMCK